MTLADHVGEKIRPLAGTEEGGKIVGDGADGTPTKYIDKVAEDLVREFFEDRGFAAGMLSEECGMIPFHGPGEGLLYVDPVDGTFNAVQGIPFYTLSVAWGEQGVIQKGFVHNFPDNETFWAIRGKGAFLNNKPIQVSKTTELRTSSMSMYSRHFDPTGILPLARNLRRWRLLGASSLELCYVACGRLDGFVDLRDTLRITDAAAGMLICEEAGGRVTGDHEDDPAFIDDVTDGRCLVATNGHLHEAVLEQIRAGQENMS